MKQIYPTLIISIMLASPLLAERTNPWSHQPRYFYQETEKRELTTYQERAKVDFGYHNTQESSRSQWTEFRDYQDRSRRRGLPTFYSDSRDNSWQTRFYDTKVNDRPGSASVR